MILLEVKRFGVIATIAILFTVFSFSLVDLFVSEPDYYDFCNRSYPKGIEVNCSVVTPSDVELASCNELGGNLESLFDVNGCTTSFFCNTCYASYDAMVVEHQRFAFIITSLIGLVAVIVTLYSSSKREFVAWILAGFMIGGILSIFVGTISYFSNMDRLVRPFVMIGEIALIIWVTVKTSAKK